MFGLPAGRKSSPGAIFVWLALFVFFTPALSYATTYKYIDEKGMPHLTDRKDTIPAKYLDRVEVVEEDHSTAYFSSKISDKLTDKVKTEYYGAQNELTGKLDTFRSMSSFASTNPSDIRTTLSEMKYAILAVVLLTVVAAVLVIKFVKPRMIKYPLLVLLMVCGYAVLYYMFKHQLVEHLEGVANVNALTDEQKEMFEKLLNNLY